VLREHIIMCDHKGVIYKGREGLDEFSSGLQSTRRRVRWRKPCRGRRVRGAVGGGIVTGDICRDGEEPVIFALANPTPRLCGRGEEGAPDAIVATGRSDFPNQ